MKDIIEIYMLQTATILNNLPTTETEPEEYDDEEEYFHPHYAGV